MLSIFESRLDVILYRAHFTKTVRAAKQLILHKHIKVNKEIITTDSYLLKSGDIVSVDEKIQKLIVKNINASHIWPIPQKHLYINYKTLEICLIKTGMDMDLSLSYPFKLNSYYLLRYVK